MKVKELPQTLCQTCSWGTVIENDTGIDFVSCGYISGNARIRRKVTRCSGFKRQNEQSIVEMRQIAWILEEGKKIGFRPPKERNYEPAEIDEQ